ncbi:uncharacterized protein ATC70_005827 [Mucor velutinosus]|uniref:F-box domain-containing protein n=1 Tax=Mucor velutinosus TaxID=708070 RepID=A0AAN7DFL0_9FUNG|nr:hypothetical protein ATC70_005827 [Mucor velutinosus]
MSHSTLLSLPYELVLHIGQYLEFADVWYLGTCSHASRTLSFQLLQSLYQINLIKPRIINPFGQSIHAAVAYLARHGNTGSTSQQQHIIQSVANHLAIGICDRMPSKSGRAFSLDFLLNKSLAILLEHCLLDSTLHAFMKSQETHILSQQFDQIISSIRAQHEQPFEQQRYTGVLMVDFLAGLHDTLVAVLEEEDMLSNIYHHLLTSHLQKQLRAIQSRYQSHHSDQSSYSNQQAPRKDSLPSQEFKLYIKLICCLAQTNLISSNDIDSLTYHYINHFFLTRPSDVSFSRDSGLKIYIRQHNEHLSIINTVTLNKRPAYHYQWRLWLEETQLRLSVLLDLLRAMIQKNCSQGGAAPDFVHITAMLQDTVSALTLSKTIPQNEYEIPLLND